MRTLCFFLVLFIGGFLIHNSAYSQIQVEVVEPCPDDDFIQSMGVATVLITAGVTIAGKTTTSDTLRGLSFVVGGIFVLAVHEPENTECITLIDGLAISSIMGGVIGLALSWLDHSLRPTSPNVIPTLPRWNYNPYAPYPMSRWNISGYRRGLKFTYRF